MQFGSESALIPDGNWIKGWERTWMDSFILYNLDPNYGIDVLNHSIYFYPQQEDSAL